MSLASVASAIVQSPQYLAAGCIPTNNTLSGPLNPVINLISGAFGGLMQTLAIGMFVVLIVIALIMIVSKKSAGIIRLAGIVLAIPIVAVIVLVIYNAAFTAINNAAAC